MKRSKDLRIILFLFAVLAIAACNNDNSNCDPNATCDTTEPTEGNLSLKVTVNDQNPSVVVTIFKGNFENGNVYLKDTIAGDTTYVVGFDKYSATAVYKKDAATITAVDGSRVSLATSTNCGYTCYGTNDGTMDLRLK